MRSIILTGAAGGIGMATMPRLAADHVIYAGYMDDWERSILERVADDLGRDRIKPVLCDVRNFDQIEETVARVEAEAPDLRAVIANGGICPFAQPLEHTDFDLARDISETNWMGNAKLAQRSIPMLKRTKGRIVFVGSLWGLAEGPLLWAYSASKHGMEALAACSRRELHQFGIDVVMINPGLVKHTYMGARLADEIGQLLETSGIDPRKIADLTYDIGGNTRLKETTPVPDPNYNGAYSGLYWILKVGLQPDKMKAFTTADKCANAIVSAITSKRPKTHYIMGWDARVTVFLNRVLPVRWMDKLMIAAGKR